MSVNVISPTKLTSRFEDALVYAHQLHATQLRKGGNIPYISHLLSVAALVIEDGGDEDEAIAALLHDAIEDQGGAKTREIIRENFGDRVTSIVEACSESDVTPKQPWKERKDEYLRKMRDASPEVLRVSLADKVHNARSILFDTYKVGDKVWQRFNVGKEESLWFYQSLLEIYQAKNTSYLVKELARIITELEKI